jgi:peptidoglycan/xylan/chitin deacetylase (PgdA/CDA1 family)
MAPILMYHYLADPPADSPHRGLYVPPAEFAAQLELLRRRNVATLSPTEYSQHLTDGAFPRSTWLTFDDGKLDNHAIGLPLLKKYGAKATFFVTVEPCLSSAAGYMPVPALKEMIAEGMSIGSHTMTHPRLARLPEDEMRREIIDSRKRLQDALGDPIDSFCYPYGNWDKRVLDTVAEAGYSLAVSTVRGNRNGEAERWCLKRAMVQPGRTGLRFRYLFGLLYHWEHSFKNRGKWKPRAS